MNTTIEFYASIIIVTNNKYNSITKNCIDSLLTYTSPANYELIIVDNGSNDNTVKELRILEEKHENINIILSPVNMGYAKANNIGLKLVNGDFIALLNNDTLLSPGWLNSLVSLLQAKPKLGMVGPVSNSVGNEQMVSLPGLNKNNYNLIFSGYAKRNKGHWFTVPRLGFFCAVMRREVLDKVGLLDERFDVGFFEDDDYCLRIRNAGYDLGVAEDTFVYHFGGASFSQLSKEKCSDIFKVNSQKFSQKHKVEWCISDIIASYINKFEHDLADYSSTHPIPDPRIERILLRINHVNLLVQQVRAVEVQNKYLAAQDLKSTIFHDRWRARFKVFSKEFICGSIREKKFYIKAILRKLLYF